MGLHNMTLEQKREARKQLYRLDFPYTYGISLGEYRCNRVCRMCPMFNLPPKEQRFITDDVVERSCYEFGDRDHHFEISAYGETFQHPKADDYLFTVRKLCPNAQIVVATNGSLLNPERCEKIVDSGINHLSFSMDANSPETYQWLTGSKQFEKTCRNLETLVEERNKRGAKHLKITCHIIGIKELSHEFDPFLNRWKGIVDQAYVRNYGNWAGMVDNNGVSAAEAQPVPATRYPCAWLWYATKIEPNGDVSKCFIHVTGDRNPLGNIMKESFESIWHGYKMRMLRELHLRNEYDKVEHCSDCSVWSLFPHFWEEEAPETLAGNFWK